MKPKYVCPLDTDRSILDESMRHPHPTALEDRRELPYNEKHNGSKANISLDREENKGTLRCLFSLFPP